MRRLAKICIGVLGVIGLAGCTNPSAQPPTNLDAVQASTAPLVIATHAAAPPLVSITTATAAPTDAPLPIVYFMQAAGCEACDLMRPTVHEVAKQYKGAILLNPVNMYTDAGERLANELGVRGYPVLVFTDRNGAVVLRRFGLQTKEQIEKGYALLADTP